MGTFVARPPNQVEQAMAEQNKRRRGSSGGVNKKLSLEERLAKKQKQDEDQEDDTWFGNGNGKGKGQGNVKGKGPSKSSAKSKGKGKGSDEQKEPKLYKHVKPAEVKGAEFWQGVVHTYKPKDYV